MRQALPIVLAVMIALVGCTEKSDEQRVQAAFEESPFFRSLGGVPASDDGYQGKGGGLDGDTTWPVGAWRAIRDPEINWEIRVNNPFAEVDFFIEWPCTLYVVYTDLPDTSIRDTVVKPAPEIKGRWSLEAEFDGEEWHLTEMSTIDAVFDSAVGMIELDSIQVAVYRSGEKIPYPTLTGTGRLSLNPYPYTFRHGDSLELRLWENHAPGLGLVWSFLHGPPRHRYSPFKQDPATGSWAGTWVIDPAATDHEERWVYFEVLDLDQAILKKTGPDRSVLWGVPYIVE